MKNKGIGFLLILAILTLSTYARNDTPATPVSFKGHRYIFVERETGYTETHRLCKSMGGYLAKADTDDEEQFLTEQANLHQQRFFIFGGYVGTMGFKGTGFVCEFDK